MLVQDLSLQGLHWIGALTSLHTLHLPIASQPLNDTVLSSFAPLMLLEDLNLCNIQDVTDTGLVCCPSPFCLQA